MFRIFGFLQSFLGELRPKNLTSTDMLEIFSTRMHIVAPPPFFFLLSFFPPFSLLTSACIRCFPVNMLVVARKLFFPRPVYHGGYIRANASCETTAQCNTTLLPIVEVVAPGMFRGAKYTRSRTRSSRTQPASESAAHIQREKQQHRSVNNAR